MLTIRGRLRLIALGMIIVSGLMIARLLSFQYRLDPEVQEQLYSVAGASEGRQVEYRPNRGRIYDRDGRVLAVNTMEYRVGISPGAIGAGRETKREVAKDLARILELDEYEVFLQLLPNELGQYPRYVPLKSPVSLEAGEELEELDVSGLVIEPIYRRDYPQEQLTNQLIGFVNLDSVGYWGVEQHYQAELAGQSKIATESGLPADVLEDVNIRDGQDLVLTIDRDIQWFAQQALQDAVEREQALGGTIIVMNPRTGEILAMVSLPDFTLEDYNNLPEQDKPTYNPAIHDVYEPGSIFKILTAAVALDIQKPGLDMFWSYNNVGCEEMAGVLICDSERVPKGPITFPQCLVRSLNTCTAHWNLLIGRDNWYTYLENFGFGRPTGVDMAGEESGIVNWPGTGTFSEANFLQTSFGQGISVTPLQILVAANAIANDGLMMQPFIVQKFYDGDIVYEQRPTAIGRPISAATAQQVLEIMEQAVSAPEGFGDKAELDGFSVAGKTGTAQKLAPDFSYSDDETWASFIGFVPADNPHLSILIMLDDPESYWGSQAAAPVFAELASRLVVLLEIPPDGVRTDLMNNGGNPFGRR
ncbi:MAG: penicillin-binding protein 2 [Chloroflexi bacterium]|nr:penicillin-binding protein 2 [Chloroflexota bacterium]